VEIKDKALTYGVEEEGEEGASYCFYCRR